MSEALALTPSEEVLVGEVIGKGSSAVNSGNIDVLISAMLKVGNDTFTAIKTIVVNDSKRLPKKSAKQPNKPYSLMTKWRRRYWIP